MIADIKIGTPTIATVQKVGNKTKEEGITFTTRADDVSFASEFISSLIKIHLSLMYFVNLILSSL